MAALILGGASLLYFMTRIGAFGTDTIVDNSLNRADSRVSIVNFLLVTQVTIHHVDPPRVTRHIRPVLFEFKDDNYPTTFYYH